MRKYITFVLLFVCCAMSAQTLREWRQRANQGEVEAMHQIGLFYFVGDSVSQDYPMALSWFQKSAEHNYPRSLHNIAIFYIAGAVVPVDTAMAIHYLHRAAALDYTPSMSGLATIYRTGGTFINSDSCVYWERKAADLGDTHAQYMMSAYYEHGFGVEADAEEAFRWMLQSAEGGYPPAEEGVANYYMNGTGVRKDYQKMVMWFERAASHGRNTSRVYLGTLYQWGAYGLPLDKKKAFELFQLAASEGDSWGAFELGQCYRLGSGTVQDKDLARYWIKKAADAGWQSAIEVWQEIDTGIDNDELRRKNEEYKRWFKVNR